MVNLKKIDDEEKREFFAAIIDGRRQAQLSEMEL